MRLVLPCRPRSSPAPTRCLNEWCGLSGWTFVPVRADRRDPWCLAGGSIRDHRKMDAAGPGMTNSSGLQPDEPSRLTAGDVIRWTIAARTLRRGLRRRAAGSSSAGRCSANMWSVSCRGAHRAAHQRRVRDRFSYQEYKESLIRIQREQAEARGGQDRPVHQGDRESDRLDHAAALVGGTIEQRRFDGLAAAAPGAGDHRARAARRHR